MTDWSESRIARKSAFDSEDFQDDASVGSLYSDVAQEVEFITEDLSLIGSGAIISADSSMDNKVVMTSDRTVAIWGTDKMYLTYKIPPNNDVLSDVFMDPTGNHVIVTTSMATYYSPCRYDYSLAKTAGKKGKQPQLRLIEQLRGIPVTNVAFNPYSLAEETRATRSMLFAVQPTVDAPTNRPCAELLEVAIDTAPDGSVSVGLEERWQLASLGMPDTAAQVISGLCMTSIDASASAPRFVVLVSTANPSILLQFVGGPNLAAVLSDAAPGHTMPGDWLGPLPQRSLNLHSSGAFGWLTPCGIMHGRLTNPDGVPRGQLALHFEGTTIRLMSNVEPAFADESSDSIADGPPVALAIDAFSFYVLYSDVLHVIRHPPGLKWSPSHEAFAHSLEDLESRVTVHSLPPNDRAVGLVLDTQYDDALFVVTTQTMIRVEMPNARSTARQRYLDQAMSPAPDEDPMRYFASAMTLAKEDVDADALEEVLNARAMWQYSSGQYRAAAKAWAITRRTAVESVILKFYRAAQIDGDIVVGTPVGPASVPAIYGLLYYFRTRIAYMRRRSRTVEQENSQRVILATWSCILFLQILSSFPHATSGGAPPFPNDAAQVPELQSKEALLTAFKEFLRNAQKEEILEEKSVMMIMSSNADPSLVEFLAEILHDYDRLISMLLNDGFVDEAVAVLMKHCASKRHEKLWYRYSTHLIQQRPEPVVEGWRRLNFLNPRNLIPALCMFDAEITTRRKALKPGSDDKVAREKINSDALIAIHYLEIVLERSYIDQGSLVNLLVSFYVHLDDSSPLVLFLRTSPAARELDLRFALRLCLDSGRNEAAVLLYKLMGLPDDAVELALSSPEDGAVVHPDGPVKLAAQIINDIPASESDVRKRLWLRVAKYLVPRPEDPISEQSKAVQRSMALLQGPAKGSLALEDILPYFPDFARVQDFRQEICSSLESYNESIERLRGDMAVASRTVVALREDVSELKHRFGYVAATRVCDLCSDAVLTAAFFVFPSCKHVYHAACLTESLSGVIPPEKYARAQQLCDQLSSDTEPAADSKGTYEKSVSELEKIVASECTLCGNSTAESVMLPLDNVIPTRIRKSASVDAVRRWNRAMAPESWNF